MDRSSSSGGGAPDSSHVRQSSSNSSRSRADSLSFRQSGTTVAAPTHSSASSVSSSVSNSPLASREPSPSRSLRASIAAARNPSIGPGTRSRKNSHQDLSPSRPAKATPTTSAPSQKTISAATTPTLLPISSDTNVKAPVPQKPAPQKSPNVEQLRDTNNTPRWPVSPRLRSPPPILNKPNLAPSRKPDLEPPLISLQRSTPPVLSGEQGQSQSQSDAEPDDSHLQPGMRTPVRGGSASTLETVEEASPMASPHGIDAVLEKLEDSLISDTSSQPDVAEGPVMRSMKERANLALNESGSENGSVKADRRPTATSAPPPLTSRQSSTSTITAKPSASGGKGKPNEGTVKSMTVETETVTSIPQVALASSGIQGSNGSLRTKPSSETIRPKKDKRKNSRKQQMVQPGAGEVFNLTIHCPAVQPRQRHYQSIRPASAPGRADRTDACISPTRSSGQGPLFDDATSPRRPSTPVVPMAPVALSHPSQGRSQSLSLYQVNKLLTRSRAASSKADNFEAKIAHAVDEADTSDSEETFVYDSNPPDRDRPHQRFHSRTPSATSMASQINRSDMRSIHSVMEGHQPVSSVALKKKKFSNALPTPGSESGFGDDEGSTRGNPGSARGGGTGRQQPHHIGVWGRNGGGGAGAGAGGGGGGGNGHTYLFDNDSPFTGPGRSSRLSGSGNVRQSSGPPSPRVSNSGRGTGNGKRSHMITSGAYDLDDTTTGADDRTPLLDASMRSSRSRRNGGGIGGGIARYHHSLAADHAGHAAGIVYRHPPSLLNRMASCLVLTVMLLLVVSGAIGFMFATSQPLTSVELVKIDNVIASEQELMFDMTVKAQNPNVMVVVVDSSDLEVFAKSPHAGTDSEWWRKPNEGGDGGEKKKNGLWGSFTARRRRRESAAGPSDSPASPAARLYSTSQTVHVLDDPIDDPPLDDTAPNMRLGTILELDQPFSFEGSFFNKGASVSRGGMRLQRPGNGTDGGSERWERILDDEFDLILKGVLKYSLPMSQRVRTIAISGRTKVKPNSANDPVKKPAAWRPGDPGVPEGEKGEVSIS